MFTLIADHSFGDGADFWSTQSSNAVGAEEHAAADAHDAGQLAALDHRVHAARRRPQEVGGFGDGQQQGHAPLSAGAVRSALTATFMANLQPGRAHAAGRLEWNWLEEALR